MVGGKISAREAVPFPEYFHLTVPRCRDELMLAGADYWVEVGQVQMVLDDRP